MPFFIATMSHPRLTGMPFRSGFPIFAAPDRATVATLVAADPFAVEEFVESLAITQRNPLSGVFGAEFSGHLRGLLTPLPPGI